jgi:hypothetical protein
MASDRAISENEIKSSIDKMVLSKEYKYKIIKVSKIVNDLCVVAITQSYREFPNVIVFKFENNRWYRVFEGLSIGIQANPSDKLDLHTIGFGADVLYDDKPLLFDDSKTRKAIADMATKRTVIIPYEDFTHIHISKGSEELYTIDKSNFTKYAIQLLGDSYYPKSRKECILFDMPEILDIQFDYKDDRFIIQGNTDNNQTWTISFDGVDADKNYLENKKITVKKR